MSLPSLSATVETPIPGETQDPALESLRGEAVPSIITRVQGEPPLWRVEKPSRPVAHSNSYESALRWSEAQGAANVLLLPAMAKIDNDDPALPVSGELAQGAAVSVVGVLGSIGAEAWHLQHGSTIALGVFWPATGVPDAEDAVTAVLAALREGATLNVSALLVANATTYEQTTQRAIGGRVAWEQRAGESQTRATHRT